MTQELRGFHRSPSIQVGPRDRGGGVRDRNGQRVPQHHDSSGTNHKRGPPGLRLPPRGNTALAVGKNGTALRYSVADHSLEPAASQQNLGFDTVQAVSWNANGEWAYLGTAEGSLFRMRSTSDGSAEVIPIPGTEGSAINAIDCLPDPFVCVVVSQDQGVGVIDRDHRLSWAGG